jgi:aryl-alcohol dehydrogenase-like predicted oxidoreductase
MLNANGFYRDLEPLGRVSSIGIGTYLGGLDEATDQAYFQTLAGALTAGVNFIDTSLNYRHQRSERVIGDTLATGKWPREQLVIASKAGYLVPHAAPRHVPDVVNNQHCLDPLFLHDQCDRSLANLRIPSLDIFYLHNPETQLAAVTPADFGRRCRRAFEACEELAAAGKIRFYGMATWNGFREESGSLELPRIVEWARAAAGEKHRFRFVQAPFNFAMTEILTRSNQPLNGKMVTLIEAAAELDVHVITSASLLQSRLSRDLPDALRAQFPGLETDAQRALQFARSAPGVSVALVGMSSLSHLRENLALRDVPPLATEAFARLFRS